MPSKLQSRRLRPGPLEPDPVKPPPLDPVKQGLSLRPNPGSGIGASFRPEVRIAAIYVVIASIWIIGSDTLLECSIHDKLPLAFLQTFKGLNFVITTGVLLFLVLRISYGGWRKAEEQRMAVATAARECFRNLSNRLEHLREEERTRISREIHDELGQHLTGLKFQLRVVENHLTNREDRSLNPIIDEIVESLGTVDETITSVRRIASGLRPPALDHLGLDAALHEEADHFTRRTGVPCALKTAGLEMEIPPKVLTATFRIFQESLTNVARHAKADQVEAHCTVEADTLHLTVRDNGVGMDPAIATRPDSLGLLGMMERACNSGGSLIFNRCAGNGTEVDLTIPLAASRDAET
jgi:signal transduction histidine kinase